MRFEKVTENQHFFIVPKGLEMVGPEALSETVHFAKLVTWNEKFLFVFADGKAWQFNRLTGEDKDGYTMLLDSSPELEQLHKSSLEGTLPPKRKKDDKTPVVGTDRQIAFKNVLLARLKEVEDGK